MATKKRSRSNKPILFPPAGGRMEQIRYQIAERMGYITSNDLNWWDTMTQMQQSEVNGMVTKMMIEKAKQDMQNGIFPR